MRYKTTKDIYRIWLRLKGNRSAPDRQDLNPAELGPNLGDVILLENRDETVRFRIAGARVCALMGGELRGRPFLDVFSHFSAEDAAEVLTTVSDDALPVIAGVSAHFPERFSMEGELLLLPFTHARGTEGDTRILGALSTRSQRPQALALAPCVELEILSFRVLAEGDTARLLPGDAVAGGALAGKSTRGRTGDAAALRRARFQLVEGGLR